MLPRILVGLLFLSLSHANALAEPDPKKPVEALNTALLETMKNAEALGYTGRYANLDPILRATFDFPQMARISTGRHWRTLGKAEQQSFVELFTRISVATFADRFDGYSGQEFAIGGVEEARPGVLIVRNRIVDPDGSSIPIDYVVQQTDDVWRIVDVFLDGKFSELAVRRSEYTSVLRRQGVDALMTAIDRKIAQIEGSG